MLQHPEQQEYKEFLDELYDIYQQAVRFQKDRRLTVGRKAKSQQLQERIIELCTREGDWINEGCSQFHLELEGLKKANAPPVT